MGSVSCVFLAASYGPNKYGPLDYSDFHSALNVLSQSEFRLSELNSKIWCTLDDLRSIGESIRMPPPEQSPEIVTSSEGPSTELGDIQRQFARGNFSERLRPLTANFLPSLVV